MYFERFHLQEELNLIELVASILQFQSVEIYFRFFLPTVILESLRLVTGLADGTVSGSDVVAPNEIAIESIRRDEVPGIHSIEYDSEADKITITHDAHSRKGFALGAVLAAEYTAEHSGLLTISDMFQF